MSEFEKRDDSAPEWVTCQHSIERLLEFLDGTLPPMEMKALERHFKACPPCIEFLRKYRSTPDLCRRALEDDLPQGTADRLSSFLRDKLKA